MAADSLTSIWAVYDSVIFVSGLAIGAGGRQGVDFIIHTIQALRGQDPHKNNPHQQGQGQRQPSTQGQPRDENGQFASTEGK